MLEHRQTQVIARAEKAEQSIAVVTQILHQNSGQIFEEDAAAGKLFSIAVLGQIGIAAVGRAALLDRLVKREMLEGVEGVVVNEDADWPLRGEIVSCMLDQM